MEDTMLFRQVVFGGLHKGDVLSYIENLEAANEDTKLALKDEMEHLKNEVEKYKSRCDISEVNHQKNEKEDDIIRKLKINLDASEKARYDLKVQIRQLEMQKAELLKRLRESSRENSNIHLIKIQEEAKNIIQQQCRDSESILENVKTRVASLIDNEKKKNSELQQVIDDQAKKIENSRLEMQAIKEELLEREIDNQNLKEILQQKENELSSERQRNFTFQKQMEGKELELKLLREEIEEKKFISNSDSILRKNDEQFLFSQQEEKQNKTLDEELFGDITFGEQFMSWDDEKRNINTSRNNSSDVLTTSNQLENDNQEIVQEDEKVLSDIFSEAKESLNMNEKEKQRKIIDLSEVV